MQPQSSHQPRENQSKTLVKQIQQHDWFRHLHAQIKQLQHLQKLFEDAIGVTLGAQCRVLEIKEGCLVVQIENATWATTLRYEAPEIVKKLQKLPEFVDVKTLRPQIYNNPWPQSQTKLTPNTISAASAAAIVAVADGIKDAALRERMLRLAKY